MKFFPILVAVAVVTMLSEAHSATVTLNATDDTFVFEDLPNFNYGGATPLYVGRNEFLKEYLALLRFDLSTIPAGASLNSAELRLHLVHSEGAPQPVSVSVSNASSAWSEGTVTWNSRPAMLEKASITLVPYSEDAIVSWNILPLVADWLKTAPITNRSVALRGPGDYQLREFESREGAQPPQLVVDYVAPISLSSTGSIWRYLDDGSDQGTAWVLPAFNDNSWSSGPAPLGSGQPDLRTIVNLGSPNNKHITTYFRRSFTAPANLTISNLQVRLRRDDGAVAYLNGVEIFRSNMPTGRVYNSTLATSEVSGADETTYFISPVITGSLLVPSPGINVLAAEVHLAGPATSDLAYCMGLNGNVALPSSIPVSVAQGWSTIANNFNHGGNTLNELIPFALNGTVLLKWNEPTSLYSSNVYDTVAASWSPNATLSPGEGAFVYSPAAQVLSFNGQVQIVGYVTRPPGGGRRFVGGRTPVSSTFSDLMGFSPAEGDQMHFYEGIFQTFPAHPSRTFAFSNGNWIPTPPPLVAPGQGVFVDLATSKGFPITAVNGVMLSNNALGQLVIGPLGGSAEGGFRASFGAVQAARATFNEVVLANQQISNALFGVTAFGTDGLPLAQVKGTNSIFGTSFDVIAQMTSPLHTLRVWQGASLVFEASNRPAPSAPFFANHTYLNKTPREVVTRLDANGFLVIEFKYGANDFPQLQIFDASADAQNLSGDLVQFVSQTPLNATPATPIDFLGALEFRLRQPASRTVTDIVATKFGHEVRGSGNAQLLGQSSGLRVDLPGASGNDGVRFDLAGKSAADVVIEIPPSGSVTQLVASVDGSSGSLSDVTLVPAANGVWDNQFEAAIDFRPLAASDIMVEAFNGGQLSASGNTSSGEPVILSLFPTAGPSALKVGSQINQDGSFTRTLSGSSLTATLPGIFVNLGPLTSIRFTSVGAAPLPPGAMKQLSVRGEAQAVGYVNVPNVTSSAENPFRPRSFVGNTVAPVGNATFAYNANGDLIVGNLALPGSANGVRLEFGTSSPSLPKDQIEFRFDSAIPGSTTPIGSTFRYQVEGDNGPLDWIEARNINSSGVYIASDARKVPAPFANRTLKLYLNGNLFHTDGNRPLTGGAYLGLWSQPSKVSVRIQADGALVWTFSWPAAVNVEGLVSSFSPRSIDRLEIISAPNLFPPGTPLRAVQISGSGVPSRTLLAPPPQLGVSLVSVGGTLGLKLTTPVTTRDQIFQRRSILPLGGDGPWVPFGLMLPDPLDPPPGLITPVDPTGPGAIIRTGLIPPPTPAACELPTTTVMNHFLNLSLGWQLTDLWSVLANRWTPAGPGTETTLALVAERNRLTAAGYGAGSPERQMTEELIDSVSNSNPPVPTTPPDATGGESATYTTLWVNSSRPVGAPSNDGTPAHPFGSIIEAWSHALSRDLRAVEFQVRGTFNEIRTIEIAFHTRIVGDPVSHATTVNAVFSNSGSCSECGPTRPPFRFEMRDVRNSTGTLTLQTTDRGSYTALENVVLSSVEQLGGTLVMQNCLVKNRNGSGISLSDGAQAVIWDCIVTNCTKSGVVVCGNSPDPSVKTTCRLLRTRILKNGGSQDITSCPKTMGGVVARDRADVKLDWCRLEGNRGPALVASGNDAFFCVRYSALLDVQPFTSTPHHAIGLGAYRGGRIECSFSELSGSGASDYGIQIATGGYIVLSASHVHGFPIAANNQDPAYDPFFLDRYCYYEGLPLLPVNTDPVPTPVP